MKKTAVLIAICLLIVLAVVYSGHQHGWNRLPSLPVANASADQIVANAGPDQAVYAYLNGYSKVTLDGSASQSADHYLWTQVSGPRRVELFDPELVSTECYVRAADDLLRVESYDFALVVSKDGKVSEADHVIIYPLMKLRLLLCDGYYVISLSDDIDTRFFVVNQPAITLSGYGGWHDVVMSCKNHTTGAQYQVNKIGNDFSLQADGLLPGDNRLEITGSDDMGNSRSIKTVVTYNTAVEFLHPLVMAPTAATINITEDLSFNLEIYTQNERYIPDKFDLYECDIWGELLSKVGEMYPTGQYGVYSGTIQFMRGAAGKRYFRAVCDDAAIRDKNRQMSSIVYLYVMNFDRDEERRAHTKIVNNACNEVLTPAVLKHKLTPKYVDQKINEICGILRKNPEVANTRYGYGNGVFWLSAYFKDGFDLHINFGTVFVLKLDNVLKYM